MLIFVSERFELREKAYLADHRGNRNGFPDDGDLVRTRHPGSIARSSNVYMRVS